MLFLLALFLAGFIHFPAGGWPMSERPKWKQIGKTSEPAIDHHHHRHRHIDKRSITKSDPLAYSLTLDPDSKFRMQWTPDFERQQIHFRVDISQSQPQSWFALGFSDRGDLAGADLCVAWEDWKGAFIIQVYNF